MNHDTLLPFHLSGERNSQLILTAATNPPTVAFCCCDRRSARPVYAGDLRTMPDRRDQNRIRHAMFEMWMERVSAIAGGYEDANDLDRLRHDPLLKVAVGRCPESSAALASQSTIPCLENAPRKTEAARLCAALVDHFATTVKTGGLEILKRVAQRATSHRSSHRIGSGCPLDTCEKSLGWCIIAARVRLDTWLRVTKLS
jgi:hypothetical protein